jgi:glycosyltransferase involved in cell wall biosynthesis
MSDESQVVVVIPCYNEAQIVSSLIDDLDWGLRLTPDTRVVFVDDGSFDGTAELIAGMLENRPSMGLIILANNSSKEGAILAGLDHAAEFGCATVIMDADGQHPIAIASLMIDHYRLTGEGSVARRMRPERRLGTRSITRIFYNMVSDGNGAGIDGLGDFRLLTACEVKRLVAHRERVRFSKLLYSDVIDNPREISYEAPPALVGRSSRWTFSQLVNHAVDGLVNSRRRFSRALIALSLAILGLSVVYGLVVLLDVLRDGSTGSGIPSVLFLVLFFGSLQLIVLSVLGEYLVRVLIETKQRPNYLVRGTVNLAKRPGETGG